MADRKLSSDDLCRILDSHDPFKVGPFYRMLDVFIDEGRLTVPRIIEIRAQLDQLITFLTSERTPEWGRPTRRRAR